MILEVKDVDYAYKSKKGRKILNHVSMQFEEKKFYAIVGPSGAGKTTFLSLLAAAEAEEAELLPVTVSSLLQPPAARAVRHRAAMTGYIKRFFITTSLLFFLVQFYHHFLKKTSIRGVKL